LGYLWSRSIGIEKILETCLKFICEGEEVDSWRINFRWNSAVQEWSF